MLALKPAFNEPDRSSLIQQILHATPASPRKFDASIPSDLETIVLKAIAREPQHRYQTAAALAADLECFLDDRPSRRGGPRRRNGPGGGADGTERSPR